MFKAKTYVTKLFKIQLVLYETHSEMDAENDIMVKRTMKEINRIAKMKHAALQGKLVLPNPPGGSIILTVSTE